MIKVKILSVLLFFKILVGPCHIPEENHSVKKHPKYSIRRVGKTPEKVNECSALIVANFGINGTYTLWTLNDHGGRPELYEISPDSPMVLKVWKIRNSINYDWEELAKDKMGNIYIGDFGNNYNKRKNLKIYKVNPSDSLQTDSICFSFSDQKAFPPARDEMNFDCEAFFWYKESLYLFSKNRGKGPVKIYKLPDQPGHYTAELFKEINISGMITSADISPDNKLMTLLSYGRIYFFNLTGDETLDFNSSYCKKFSRSAQSEGICFLDNSNLAVTNEQRKIFFIRRKK